MELNTMTTDFEISALSLQKARLSELNSGKEKNLTQIKETAENFEAFFMTKMMESMFEGISTDGMFGGGHAEKIYRSLLLDEYGKTMAKTGTVGISQSIMDTILDMQEQMSSSQTDEVQHG